MGPGGVTSEGHRVVQVTPELNAGGVERTTIDIAAAIVQSGGRCLVASEGGRLDPELERVGGELRPGPYASKNPFVIRANAARLARLAKDEDMAILHARSRAPAWSALWAARRLGLPFVTTYHGTYTAKTPAKRLYNSVMARGDRVIANSHFIADHIRAEHGLDGERVVVIPRGVDVDALAKEAVSPDRVAAARSAWGVAEGAPIVLLPGRLTRWKGQTVALDAFAQIANAHPGAVLVLVGDDQGRTAYREELEAQAAGLGLAERVRIPGHWADMPAAYAAAALALCPSIEPEAFGRVPAEAQAASRPVVVTDHGGARETVVDGETGVKVPVADAGALGRAIAQILQADEEKRVAMGAAGRARALKLYAVKAMQASTLAVYDALMVGVQKERAA